MMDQNLQLSENEGNEPFAFDFYSDGQSSLNVPHDNVNEFSMSDNLPIDEHVDYPATYSEEQYNDIPEQNPLSIMPPLVTFNGSDIIRFIIPGFQVVLIPMSSPLANLNNEDMQYQFQQDHPSVYSSSVNSSHSSQLNQEQIVDSSVDGIFSDGINIHNDPSTIINDNLQHHYQIQNSFDFESFSNFNNLRG
ncbi:hypothetical protein C1645_749631 [Glomus cerebriforme]|uniref:Uncharacterized protein n=1 Tax=Glomus cerebriforme TaxID=658196 RepID=A0A397TPT3_9GLOM|nr:hypothetical protein C1645_749631 [Glomus cerebriforme]